MIEAKENGDEELVKCCEGKIEELHVNYEQRMRDIRIKVQSQARRRDSIDSPSSRE